MVRVGTRVHAHMRLGHIYTVNVGQASRGGIPEPEPHRITAQQPDRNRHPTRNKSRAPQPLGRVHVHRGGRCMIAKEAPRRYSAIYSICRSTRIRLSASIQSTRSQHLEKIRQKVYLLDLSLARKGSP